MSIKVLKESEADKEAIAAYYDKCESDIKDIEDTLRSAFNYLSQISYEIDTQQYPVNTDFHTISEELDKVRNKLKSMTAKEVKRVWADTDKLLKKHGKV